jgi:hypothetical protein
MEALDQFHKNIHKASYYLTGYLRLLVPGFFGVRQYTQLLREFERMDNATRAEIVRRVNYYNKLTEPFVLNDAVPAGKEFSARDKSAAYYVDYSQLLSFFPRSWRASYLLGDITHIPDEPTFLKSRPVRAGNENANSILLKLNQIRHYYFVKDRMAFADKLPMLVWRGKTNQPERTEFLQRFYGSPVCDVGDTYKKNQGTAYAKPFMSIPEQLRYKYVLSIEGFDVATNTKWIMASNSVCFMRKPRFETWFMEGSLIPGVHYVQLKEDHSDLEEKVAFYNDHPELANEIVINANRYVDQFRNHKQELIISVLVMQKYFRLSGQMQPK